MIIKKAGRVKAAIFVGLCALTLSCGDTSDDEEKDDENNAGENGGVPANSSNPEASKAVAALDVEKPDEVFGAGGTALQSAQIGTLALSLALQDNADDNSGEGSEGGGDQSQSENDPLCSSNGDPWDTENDQVLEYSEDYVQRRFYCKVNSKTVESVDTIPGYVAQQRSLICSATQNYNLTLEDFTAEGKEHVTADNPNMELSEACWPQGTPGANDPEGPMTEVPMDSVKTTALPADSGWQYEISLKSEAVGVGFSLRYFVNEGVFGFQTVEAGNTPGIGDTRTLTVDTVNGILLYDEVGDRNGAGGADSVYGGLARIRVKGTLGEDLTFSEIEEGSGYIYVSGPGFDGTSDKDHAYSVYSVSGTSEKGWQWKHFQSAEDSADLSEAQAVCEEGDETCADSADPGTLADMAAYFKFPAAAREAWAAYGESGKPLCDPADGSTVGITPAPPHTGNLGRCE